MPLPIEKILGRTLTREGERKDGVTTLYIAAAVLPTGQLVVAHEHGGVYRVTLSGECV